MTTPAMRFLLSPGEAGVGECLAGMAEIVRQCKVLNAVGTGARVQEAAHRLALGTDPAGYCDRVYTFLRAHLEYTDDPPFTELVRHPDELLGTAAAKGKARCDCDEVATLGASLLWMVGIEPAFIVVGRPGNFDGRTGRVKLSHVFYAARLGSALLPFDPQERTPPGAWPEPAAIGRLERYDILPQNRAAA